MGEGFSPKKFFTFKSIVLLGHSISLLHSGQKAPQAPAALGHTFVKAKPSDLLGDVRLSKVNPAVSLWSHPLGCNKMLSMVH